MEREYAPGKRGGAVCIEGEQAALIDKGGEEVEREGEQQVEQKGVNAPVEIEELISPETNVHTASTNMTVFDLYEVGHKRVTHEICKDMKEEIPFAHQIKLHGPQGEIV